MRAYEEPLFLISTVAKMLNIHPQTLRQYEKEWLVKPKRTKGNVRMYSQKDIDRLKYIIYLTREVGANISSIEIILDMQDRLSEYEKRIRELERKIEEIFKYGISCIPTSKSIIPKKSEPLVPIS